MSKDKDDDRRRFLKQHLGMPLQREWPEGRLNGDDDGQLSVAIAVDLRKKVLVIDFGMPVAWIGMSAANARELITLLDKHAKTLEEASG